MKEELLYQKKKKHTLILIAVSILIPFIFVLVIIAYLINIRREYAIGTDQNYTTKDKLILILQDSKKYFEENKTYIGFTSNVNELGCKKSKTILNISSDGKKIAIFGKSCTLENAYYCFDSEANHNVDLVKKEYIDAKNASCP